MCHPLFLPCNDQEFVMPLVPISRALAIAGCFLLFIPIWVVAEDGSVPPSSPNSSDVSDTTSDADSRALIGSGRFGEALTQLRPLLEADVVEANALFLYGLAAAGASQGPDVPDDVREALLDEAIGAFRTMLFNDPGLIRVRLELARAFFLKGEDDLSELLSKVGDAGFRRRVRLAFLRP